MTYSERLFSSVDHFMAICVRGNIRQREPRPQEERRLGTQGKKHLAPHLKLLCGNGPFPSVGLHSLFTEMRTKAFPRF